MKDIIEKAQKAFNASPWRRPELLVCLIVHAMGLGVALDAATVQAEEALPDPDAKPAPKAELAIQNNQYASDYAKHFGMPETAAPGPVVSPFALEDDCGFLFCGPGHNASFRDPEIVGDLEPTDDGDKFEEPV